MEQSNVLGRLIQIKYGKQIFGSECFGAKKKAIYSVLMVKGEDI